MSHAFAWRPAMFASLALVPVLSLGAGAAHAQSVDADSEVHSMTLSYGDLDLSTAKGRSTLNARIRRAAAEVCGQQAGVRQQPLEPEYRACFNRALTGARQELAQKQAEIQLVRR